MVRERTLSMVKPDAVEKNCIGAVLARLEQAEVYYIYYIITIYGSSVIYV